MHMIRKGQMKGDGDGVSRTVAAQFYSLVI
ncbi:hypothetical protein QFZ94_008936 [Paraburkholderia sp. JPY465]